LGREGQDLRVEAGAAALVLGEQLGFQSPVAVAGRVERAFAAFAADGCLRVPVPPIVGSLGVGRRGRIRRERGRRVASEGEVHLRVEQACAGGLHQGTAEAVAVVEGLGLGGDVGDELFDVELAVGVHAKNLRKEGDGGKILNSRS
jgi:hypothetical protein